MKDKANLVLTIVLIIVFILSGCSKKILMWQVNNFVKYEVKDAKKRMKGIILLKVCFLKEEVKL